jgi:hypothetical protein
MLWLILISLALVLFSIIPLTVGWLVEWLVSKLFGR